MIPFKDDAFMTAISEWWESLEDDRGQRAALRRCAGKPGDASLLPEYHRGFVRFLKTRGFNLDDRDWENIAPAVVVLACAKRLSDTSLPRLMAQSDKGSELVRDARFRRLLAIRDRDGLALGLCRLVKQLDGQCNAQSVLKSVVFWNDMTRRAWAREYYSVQQQ
ncbi:CRISPR system Cascade subunit CasB [Desulfobaculum xiamenense]|uniref:CRISPR system Cascade subunit CasB n=1 Tax=Desulfobaculum xiamenense TaxID=995050 RepID=A0A846QI32_9BACT|nr:type I-E CRISPR-associated protein Cse2/CasB [Desulfobaculum xiamenense]NJB67908.1 CRISPR system Cascade subunit CasB [Desulfobaculum xiamenense]